MKFYFSLKTTIICVVLAILMIQASFWQWERYHWKLDLIAKLTSNVEADPIPYQEAVSKYAAEKESVVHRRINISGRYDFEHEMVLRNRRFKDEPGVFVITPLKVVGTNEHILVNRGFLPLSKSKKDDRAIFERPTEISFTGLIKESSPKKFLAPADDPVNPNGPWVDSWIRVDVENMSKQLPYSVSPFYLEIMSIAGKESAQVRPDELSTKIQDTRAGREEMFFLPGKAQVTFQTQFKDEELPVPIFDTVVPPGRHYGYIFEWAIMAAATLLIGFFLQLRKPKGLR